MTGEATAPAAREAEAGTFSERSDTLALVVGGVEFGIPLDRVLTVVRVPPITRLPFPPPNVVGIASVRGAILPVVDLAERLLGSTDGTPDRLVVVEDPATGQEFGLLVDRVTSLLASESSRTVSPEEVEVSLPPGWVTGVVSPDPERLVTLLDLEPVLALGTSTDKEP